MGIYTVLGFISVVKFLTKPVNSEIDHFWVPPSLCIKTRLSAQPFDMEIIFHSHANKTHFHKKGCALGNILKVRVFGTRKWPILFKEVLVCSEKRFFGNALWNYTHFTHPTNKQLRRINISSNNNSPSAPFELRKCLQFSLFAWLDRVHLDVV